MTNRDLRPLVLIVLLIVLAMRSGIQPTKPPSDEVDRVTYVFEKDDSAPPRAVQAALRALNESGIIATAIDDDAKTGTGETPEQYRVAIEAARGRIPCLVAQAGETVVEVIKEPTADDVRKYD